MHIYIEREKADHKPKLTGKISVALSTVNLAATAYILLCTNAAGLCAQSPLENNEMCPIVIRRPGGRVNCAMRPHVQRARNLACGNPIKRGIHPPFTLVAILSDNGSSKAAQPQSHHPNKICQNILISCSHPGTELRWKSCSPPDNCRTQIK